jgi:hypothetical protein
MAIVLTLLLGEFSVLGEQDFFDVIAEFFGDGVEDRPEVVTPVQGVVRIADEKAVHPVHDTQAGEDQLFVESAAGEGDCLAGGFLDGKHLGGSDLEAGVFVVCVRRVGVLLLGFVPVLGRDGELGDAGPLVGDLVHLAHLNLADRESMVVVEVFGGYQEGGTLELELDVGSFLIEDE